MRVLVTRPQPQADEWVVHLRAAGVDAVALPLIAVAPVADLAPLQQAWDSLAGCALVVFVSPNAVARFFDVPARPGWPKGVLAGAPGPGTRDALRAAGVPAEAIVEPAADAAQFDSEALWAQLVPHTTWNERRVLIVRGDGGRNWLAERLREQGAVVEFVQAYGRTAPTWSQAERALADQALAEPSHHLWVFSSSQAVDHLQTLLPAADWGGSRAVATHPRIAARTRAAGFGEVVEIRPGLEPLQELVTRLG